MNQDNYVDEDEPLTKVGQWTKSEFGSIITLKAIFEPVTIYDTELFKFNIDSVKLLEYTDIQSGDSDLLVGSKESALTLQFAYSFTNNTDKTVMFTPIDTITTNNQKQYNLDNLIGSDYTYEFKPNVTVDGYSIFLIEDNFENLSDFTIYSDQLYSDDPFTVHVEEIKHTFEVNN